MALIDRVVDIVTRAGTLMVQQMETGFSVSKKGQIDLVTDADRTVERFLVAELRNALPSAAVCAEETGWHGDQRDQAVWYVDPLDGTTNFAHGFPYFSISVALAEQGETVVGVVYNPVSRELFQAERGKGAQRNGVPIRVSDVADLQDSLLVTGFPYDVRTAADDNMARFARLTKASQGVRRTGSAALDLCNVACGRFDGYWERGVNVWDIAAGVLIVQEAGGAVTDCEGRPWTHQSRCVLATNGLIHQRMLEMLKG